MVDNINPVYYKNISGKQLIDLIELLPFTLGNSIKYVYRAGNKSLETRKQDINKAVWYFDRWVDNPQFMSNIEINPVLVLEVLEGVRKDKKVVILAILEAYYSAYEGLNGSYCATTREEIVKLL